MDESRHLRYQDNEGSRFSRAGRLSPEDTWRALGDELARVLMDAQRVFWRGRLEMTPERVRWWHGAIFARHFPYDGGRFRQESAYFGVVTADGGMRQIEGSSPDALAEISRRSAPLSTVALSDSGSRTPDVLEQTRVAGAMYAGILRVHPFADGNHRAGFVALSAALWSLGLPAVEFAQDADMTDHDDAIAPALFSPDGDIEPFARLLAARIEYARRPAT
ncbi:MAG TPA: Fic family protein [Solirubrobacteraceae bacterium]|nr:Fic family protein [Solirubrobacteraceae bacterium]